MFSNSFRIRLIAVLALALLPALVLAVVESVGNFNTSTDLAERTTVAETVRSVEQQGWRFFSALRTIERIARVPGITEIDAELCRRAVADASAASQLFDRVAVIRPDGGVACSVPDLPEGSVLEENAVIAELIANPDVNISEQFTDAQTGNLVVVAKTPIFSTGDDFTGHVLATLRVDWFDQLHVAQTIGDMKFLALVNSVGAVVASTPDPSGSLPTELFAALLRDNIGRLPGTEFEFATKRDAAGATVRMAAVPLVEDDVFLVIGAAQNFWRSDFALGLMIAVMVPLAMYALALSVAWYAVDSLVVSHINRLRGVIERIERGDDAARATEGSGAPDEIEVLVIHMNRMLDALDQRESELELALEEQKTLTKEIFHRVKNNLQIISSLMNLQLRDADSEVSKSALLAAQSRVQAMSTVHEQLYRDTNLSRIRLDTLLHDLTRSIEGRLAEGIAYPKTDLTVAPVTTDPDRAIPLALLYTEALTNAFENSYGADEGGLIRVNLSEFAPDYLNLTISNTRRKGSATQAKAGLGVKLIEVLARQLRGTVKLIQGEMYRVDLTFPNMPPETDA